MISPQRPVVRLTESKLREIHWPSYDFYYGSGMGVEKDFVLGVGAEPQLHWRTFTETMLRFVSECHIEMIVTLWSLPRRGALHAPCAFDRLHDGSEIDGTIRFNAFEVSRAYGDYRRVGGRFP